ncbi:protein FAM184A-like [Elysia marginata]|uniref:Protein FAM184A-like n=1 Tax=Elysia marginata TaxID=1093978 RepID=A0AAV4K0S0_9GAST|nr:protein FAM184A-like [Elysia marginata]
MDNSHKTRDQLLARNKQLEADMKTLRREFNKKATETRSNRTSQTQEVSEEVERLRREIQRYRLELSNRDNNFNRMFTEKQPMLVNQRNQKPPPTGAIYAFSQGNSASSKTNLTNGVTASSNGCVPEMLPNELAASQSAAPKTTLTQHNQAFFRGGREQVHQINFLDPENPVGQMERQHTLPERSLMHDRSSTAGPGKHKPLDNRPRTQHFGQKFKHDRLISLERSTMRQTSSALYTEQPTQILPQRNGERPISSSLPSICSTPEQRRLSAQATKPVSIQLTKPKPLPREVLYGK